MKCRKTESLYIIPRHQLRCKIFTHLSNLSWTLQSTLDQRRPQPMDCRKRGRGRRRRPFKAVLFEDGRASPFKNANTPLKNAPSFITFYNGNVIPTEVGKTFPTVPQSWSWQRTLFIYLDRILSLDILRCFQQTNLVITHTFIAVCYLVYTISVQSTLLVQ